MTLSRSKIQNVIIASCLQNNSYRHVRLNLVNTINTLNQTWYRTSIPPIILHYPNNLTVKLLEIWSKDNYFRATYTFISITNKGFLYFSVLIFHICLNIHLKLINKVPSIKHNVKEIMKEFMM